MYIRPVKGIVIILLTLLLGVFILACAPVDAAGNPIHYTQSADGYSYDIYIDGKEVKEGTAVKVNPQAEFVMVEDLFGKVIYVGWDNVIIEEK